MAKKAVFANFEGVEVLVENTWFRGARLYIDGAVEDVTDQLTSYSDNKPILKTIRSINGVERCVEVFCVAWVFVKIRICVDGVPIGGDIF